VEGKVVGVTKDTEGELKIFEKGLSETQTMLDRLCVSGRTQGEYGLSRTHIKFSPARMNAEIDPPM